jgi:hypothetical protein
VIKIEHKFSESDMRQSLRKLEVLHGDVNVMLSTALNEVGDDIEKNTKQQVADQTGLTIASVARFFNVKYSTPANLVYELRVSYDVIEDEKNSKPLPQRGFPGREVREMPDESKLVNLVTMKDGKVCKICQMIEDEGPYSMEEFNRLRDVHPHLLNKALHCRCSLVPFKPEGREAGRTHEGQKAHIDLHTAQQDLVQSIRAKTRKMIKDRGL